MFWKRKEKKSQPLHEFYKNRKYDQDYSWIDYYRPNSKKSGHGWGDAPARDGAWRRKAFYRVVAVLSILAVLFTVRELNNPVGENVREGLRYVLTTEWNVRPAMEKAVKFGLQVAGVDSQLDSGMPQEGMMKETMSKTAITRGMLIPVSGKVVRAFGWNRDPMDEMDRFHHGIDIAVNPGTAVKAVLPGKVLKIGSTAQYGRFILVDHGEGVFTLYAGVENIRVGEGQQVKAGDSLGEAARAGDIKGGGLHFELRENGSLVDPLTRVEIPSTR